MGSADGWEVGDMITCLRSSQFDGGGWTHTCACTHIYTQETTGLKTWEIEPAIMEEQREVFVKS